MLQRERVIFQWANECGIKGEIKGKMKPFLFLIV